MKKNLIICILSLFVFSAQAQKVLPFSRVDSALINENNQKYQLAYDGQNYRAAAKKLDENAIIYWKHYKFDEAINFYLKSLELNERIGNENGVAGINSNLALIYADQGNYEKAYEFFEKTLSVRKNDPNNKIGVISVLINESVVLNKLKRYNQAVEKLQVALTLALEEGDEDQMKSIYGMLSETYQRAGNTEKALYYYEYFKTFNNYVTKKIIEESNEKIEEEVYQRKLLELENQNKELELERQNWLIEKQEETIGEITLDQKSLIDSLTKQELAIEVIAKREEVQRLNNQRLIEAKEKQQLVVLVILIAFIFLLILLIWLFITFRKKNKLNNKLIIKNAKIAHQSEEIKTQRDELISVNGMLEKVNVVLEDKNKQITSSINYAQRIQSAILVGSEKLFNLFDDSFLIFRPKDIVAGDFYYFKKLNDNENMIIVGDCTGHGVPGAFLTVLGVNILNTLITDRKITKPETILRNLDKQFYRMLNQEKTEVGDGMDISICLINQAENKIEFSGARNPLVLVTENEIEYIKATPISIGYSEFIGVKNKEFATKIIDVTEPSWCYMFSDGIIDQFDENQKRFTRKKLLEILRKNFSKSGKTQKKQLIKAVADWQGGYEQIDDIIMLGIKINNNSSN